MKRLFATTLSAIVLLTSTAFAQDDQSSGQVGEMMLDISQADLFKKPGYSPYAGRNFPTRVY